MHMKLLSIGFVALFLLSTVLVAATPVSAEPSGTYGSIWVEPDYVNGTEVGLNNNFTVEVMINISDTAGDPTNPGIFAFGYWLTWNDTLLEVVDYNVFEPSDGVWQFGSSLVDDSLKDTDVNGKNDTHSYAVTALGATPTAFNGVMTLANYTLKVTYLGIASCNLAITDKGFIFSDEVEYPLNVYDGLYDVIPEFPLALILPLFMVATLIAAILGKKAWLRKRRNPFIGQ